jgi:hypothetical protein
MRKLVAVAAVLGLVASLGASPALAGKKPTKVHESFGATLAPFPKLAAWGDALGLTKPGCTAGEEGVHWVAHEFTSPGYIFDGDTALYKSEGSQYDGSAPAEEEIVAPLKKGQVVTLVACNWLGHPDVVAHYEGTFK